MLKLNSKQLRAIDANAVSSDAKSVIRNPLVFILENIYDTYNIGGIFRLADGLGVAKIYLCGDTETPPNNRIHKASCGTYKVVPWEYCKTAKEAIENFRLNDQLPNSNNQKDATVIARSHPELARPEHGRREGRTTKQSHNSDSEKDDRASSVPSERIESPNMPLIVAIEQSPISIPYTSLKPTYPLALVVGNETTGVTPETLAFCDKTVEIPMWGINKSLNVIVSAAIVSYHLISKCMK